MIRSDALRGLVSFRSGDDGYRHPGNPTAQPVTDRLNNVAFPHIGSNNDNRPHAARIATGSRTSV